MIKRLLEKYISGHCNQEEIEVALPQVSQQQVDMSSQQVGLKVAMDRVLREKSAAKEMSVPR